MSGFAVTIRSVRCKQIPRARARGGRYSVSRRLKPDAGQFYACYVRAALAVDACDNRGSFSCCTVDCSGAFSWRYAEFEHSSVP